MFKAKVGQNYDGVNIPSLAPGIYNAVLKDVKKDRTTPKDGGEGTQIITLLFEAPEGLHQHTEYDIKADDPKAASKSENLVLRLGHILRNYGVPQTTLDAMPEHANFDSLANWFMATLGQQYINVPTQIKIVGSVYQGTAKSEFPGYIPFLATGKSGTKSLSFSQKENQGNEAYRNATSSKPDSEGTPDNNSAPAERRVDF